MSVEFLSKISSSLQISIIIFGLLTPILALVKWQVDKKISSIKEASYTQKLAHLSPRILTVDQKKILIEQLAPMRGHPVAFASKMMDGESIDFTDELVSVFKEAGLDVGETNKSSLNDLPGVLGLAVTGPNLEKDAAFIANVLQSAGFQYQTSGIKEGSLTGLLPNRVYIIVGRKK